MACHSGAKGSRHGQLRRRVTREQVQSDTFMALPAQFFHQFFFSPQKTLYPNFALSLMNYEVGLRSSQNGVVPMG